MRRSSGDVGAGCYGADGADGAAESGVVSSVLALRFMVVWEGEGGGERTQPARDPFLGR